MQRIKSDSSFQERPGEFAANMLWLQTNWKNYINKWVALNNGSLLVSGDDEALIRSYMINHPNRINIMCLLVGKNYNA